ncbi:type II toxin-antitoxin system RelE/ParE family toxin [bacterium]|nr:type II toxin-antitoxin system RelE/ParE family toxin [bacterium]
MKYKVVETDYFAKWKSHLRDSQACKRIERQIVKMQFGNFGCCKPLTGYKGLYENRLDFGPGYRLYYILESRTIIIMLAGGDKSTQRRDIEIAWQIKKDREGKDAKKNLFK